MYKICVRMTFTIANMFTTILEQTAPSFKELNPSVNEALLTSKSETD